MTPLRNFDDDVAMALRGRDATLRSARADALQDLRDWCTRINSADWQDIAAMTDKAADSLATLRELAFIHADIHGAA